MGAARKYLRENWLQLACFLIGVTLIWGQLQYPSHWLNEWEESQLINSGRALAHGRLPVYALSPFLAFFYLPFFEIFKSQPMWLFDAATWGHRVLLVALWGVLLLIGRELFAKEERGALLVWPIVTAGFAGLLSNSGDAAFAVLSGLAFWQLLRFRITESFNSACLIGLFLGLAALCRADGFVLLFIVACLIVGILYQRDKLKNCFPVIMGFTLTFTLILTLDLAVQKRTIGKAYLGLAPDVYREFEQGQGAVYAERFKDENPLSAGQRWSETLYGSATKNDNNILKAVVKNPSAFSQRLGMVVKNAPRQAMDAYSDAGTESSQGLPITGFILMLSVAGGMVFLMRHRQRGLITICLAWMAYLSIYLITFYRPGYFLTVCFPLFVLAAFGLIWVIRVIDERISKGIAQYVVAVPALVLGLTAGVTRGIPSPSAYQVNETEITSAIEAIEKAVPQGGVVSSAPQLAFVAQKPWVDPSAAPQRPDHFRSWVQKNKARAMVIDGRLLYDDPNLYKRLAREAPKLGKPVDTQSENFKVYKLPPKLAVPPEKVAAKHIHRHRRRRRRLRG